MGTQKQGRLGKFVRALPSKRRRAVSTEDPETEPTRPCRHCGEPVSRGATVCLHCERELTPLMPREEFAFHFGGGPTLRPGDEGAAANEDAE